MHLFLLFLFGFCYLAACFFRSVAPLLLVMRSLIGQFLASLTTATRSDQEKYVSVVRRATVATSQKSSL